VVPFEAESMEDTPYRKIRTRIHLPYGKVLKIRAPRIVELVQFRTPVGCPYYTKLRGCRSYLPSSDVLCDTGLAYCLIMFSNKKVFA